ncbi:MAG: transglycosylase SLT domain-containing protein [Halobacteriovoraceae bacterium]|nr:transglycosylase SLT domain-containing protein [Halobacteriovoraceae bacterium]MBT5095128.1 transglycosylase SLT domain-containing protein [Halobacteriovoraceae bacterium]
MHRNLITILFFLSFLLIKPSLLAAEENFPVKGNLRTRVDFWKKVYTEVTTTEAFIHDSVDLSVIYKKVSLSSSRRKRIREAKKEKRKIASLLRSIAKKKYQNLSDQESEIVQIVGKREPSVLRKMARTVRYQYGLRDRYYTGLIRSYTYMEEIQKIFSELGLPLELSYLPHVESSFNYRAYSKIGAAGIWQFMRGTARLYKLKVSYIIDERRDPLKAAVAAAKLLKANYKLLGTWPLALTAYNHGPRSVSRAIRKLGTTDIGEIIEGYKGRRFGFASKNFYATFMATVEISKNPTRYFPSFNKPKAPESNTIKLAQSLTVKHITSNLRIPVAILKEFNPSIRRVAYRSNLFLPKGFVLNVPKVKDSLLKTYTSTLRNLKIDREEMQLGHLHIVSRGESLFDISRIYKTTITKLIAFNRISNPSRIFPGMKIKIPGKKDQVIVAKLSRQRKIETKPVIKKILPPKLGEPRFIGPPLASTANLASYALDIKKVSRGIYQIQVEIEETLGHFAEWARSRAHSIRNLNLIRYGAHINLGQKLKLRMSEKRIEVFKRRRNQFHLSLQEDFYNNFKVNGKDEYRVRKGDTLLDILKRKKLPYWLVRKEQKKFKLNHRLAVGQLLSIPEVESLTPESSLFPKN